MNNAEGERGREAGRRGGSRSADGVPGELRQREGRRQRQREDDIVLTCAACPEYPADEAVNCP